MIETNSITASTTKSKLEYIVIDTGAIIRGQSFTLLNFAYKICTIKEVINEIRDSKSRALLENLPYEIEIMTPSDKAMKSVADFCRKTGDFAALSLTDMKLIALMYTLEDNMHGDAVLIEKYKVCY